MGRGTTVVVGSSAGGSDAVECLLEDLPSDSGIRLLVVQHMLASFTRRFAERLDEVSEYEVREAEVTDSVGVNEALIARGDTHMRAVSDDGRLGVELVGGEDEPRPSVDVTMSSVADVAEGNVVGVVLSGMGSDGVDGVREIKREGGITVAQDEKTCGVFGMPRRAIESGYVDYVVPRDEIPGFVRSVAEKGEYEDREEVGR
jgi:two-component system chemotaxis response regulator CheB